MRCLLLLLNTALLLLITASIALAVSDPRSYGFRWEQFAADTRLVSMGRVDIMTANNPLDIWAVPGARSRSNGVLAGYHHHEYAVDADIRSTAVALTTAASRLHLVWNRAEYSIDGTPVVEPDGTIVPGTVHDIHERVDVFGGSYGFPGDPSGDGPNVASVVGASLRFYEAEFSDHRGSAADINLGVAARYTRPSAHGGSAAQAAIKVRNLLGRSYEIDGHTVELPSHVDFSLALEGSRRLGWRDDSDIQALIAFTHRRHLRWSYGYPSDTNHLGAEITFIEAVSIRYGWTSIPFGGKKWSWGLGLSTHELIELPFGVTIDYGQYDAGMLGGWRNLFRFSLSFAWATAGP